MPDFIWISPVSDAPIVTVPTLPQNNMQVHEFNKVNVTCRVDANPVVTNENIIWSRDNSLVTYPPGPHLIINSISRYQTGGYTCSATNQLSPSGQVPITKTGSHSISITVQCECLYKVKCSFLTHLNLNGDSIFKFLM